MINRATFATALPKVRAMRHGVESRDARYDSQAMASAGLRASERIAYAARYTATGPLVMAATARGVCFAQFGESEAALIAQRKCEFPDATHTLIERGRARQSP